MNLPLCETLSSICNSEFSYLPSAFCLSLSPSNSYLLSATSLSQAISPTLCKYLILSTIQGRRFLSWTQQSEQSSKGYWSWCISNIYLRSEELRHHAVRVLSAESRQSVSEPSIVAMEHHGWRNHIKTNWRWVKTNSSSNSDAGSYNRYTVNDERTGSSIGELRKRWSKTEGSVMIGITSSNKK